MTTPDQLDYHTVTYGNISSTHKKIEFDCDNTYSVISSLFESNITGTIIDIKLFEEYVTVFLHTSSDVSSDKINVLIHVFNVKTMFDDPNKNLFQKGIIYNCPFGECNYIGEGQLVFINCTNGQITLLCLKTGIVGSLSISGINRRIIKWVNAVKCDSNIAVFHDTVITIIKPNYIAKKLTVIQQRELNNIPLQPKYMNSYIYYSVKDIKTSIFCVNINDLHKTPKKINIPKPKRSIYCQEPTQIRLHKLNNSIISLQNYNIDIDILSLNLIHNDDFMILFGDEFSTNKVSVDSNKNTVMNNHTKEALRISPFVNNQLGPFVWTPSIDKIITCIEKNINFIRNEYHSIEIIFDYDQLKFLHNMNDKSGFRIDIIEDSTMYILYDNNTKITSFKYNHDSQTCTTEDCEYDFIISEFLSLKKSFELNEYIHIVYSLYLLRSWIKQCYIVNDIDCKLFEFTHIASYSKSVVKMNFPTDIHFLDLDSRYVVYGSNMSGIITLYSSDGTYFSTRSINELCWSHNKNSTQYNLYHNDADNIEFGLEFTSEDITVPINIKILDVDKNSPYYQHSLNYKNNLLEITNCENRNSKINYYRVKKENTSPCAFFAYDKDSVIEHRPLWTYAFFHNGISFTIVRI
jgi:hypothetical protein